eukprot:736191-Rhodomonas_salina.1
MAGQNTTDECSRESKTSSQEGGWSNLDLGHRGSVLASTKWADRSAENSTLSDWRGADGASKLDHVTARALCGVRHSCGGAPQALTTASFWMTSIGSICQRRRSRRSKQTRADAEHEHL